MRGHVGRKRLRAMRFVRQFSRLAIESVDALKPKVLEELAALVRVDALMLCFVFEVSRWGAHCFESMV